MGLDYIDLTTNHWQLDSVSNSLYRLVRFDNEKIKFCISGPLLESSGFPLKKGQQCCKHFLNMTSSCVPNFFPQAYRASHVKIGVSQGYSYKIAWLAAMQFIPRLQGWVQAVWYFPSIEIMQDLMRHSESSPTYKTEAYAWPQCVETISRTDIKCDFTLDN